MYDERCHQRTLGDFKVLASFIQNIYTRRKLMSKKQILILGGSYAGVKAAKTLHKAFKKDENVEITVIDRHSYHTLMTELHEVAGHRTDPESIKIDLKRIFAGRKVNVVVDDIVDFDLENKKLS